MKQINKKLLTLACAALVASPVALAAEFQVLNCDIANQGAAASEVLTSDGIDAVGVANAAAAEQRAACKTSPDSCGISPADFDPAPDDTDANSGVVEVTPIETYCRSATSRCGIQPSHIQDLVKLFCRQDPITNCGVTQVSLLGDPNIGETEPNDHIATADPVSTSSEIIKGQIAHESDKDFYEYQVSNKVNGSDTETSIFKTIIVTLNSDIVTWHISVLDRFGNLLSAGDSTGDEENDYQLEATVRVSSTGEKTSYYIVVEASSADDSTKPYGISISDKASLNIAEQVALNLHDAETEPNNFFKEADVLNSGIDMVGSLPLGGFSLPNPSIFDFSSILGDDFLFGQGVHFGSGFTRDVDIYKFEAKENETINLSLCGENTTCFTEKGTWAAFVFSVQNTTTDKLEENRRTGVIESIGDDSCSLAGGCPIFAQIWEFYIEAYRGSFEQALIASIDPTFGGKTSLDFGVNELPAGTYYVVIAQVETLNGATFLRRDFTDVAVDNVSILEDPKSDDQYSLRLTKTSFTPSLSDDTKLLEGAKTVGARAVRAGFDSRNGMLNIPEVEVDGNIYSGKLQYVPNSDPVLFKLDDVNPVANPVSR